LLAGRQALLTAVPPRFPRRIGTWTATWYVADCALATQRVRAISQSSFQRSLRVSDTRFLVESAKEGLRLCRQVPPLSGLTRLGPCFMVSSREAGLAGPVQLQVHAEVPGAAKQPPP